MASPITLPGLPGSPVNIYGRRQTRVQPSDGGTIAIVGTHDWGPVGGDLEEVSEYFSLSEWETDAGDSPSPSRTGVIGAFAGGATEEERGAGRVLWYRLATGGAARASSVLVNTAGTPADALRLEGLWKGTRGNRIGRQHDADPAVSGNNRLRITFDGAVVHTFSYPAGDLPNLARQVNSRSTLVRATVLLEGTPLGTAAHATLGGGNDGAVVTPTQYAAAQAALEFADFSVFAPCGLTDVPTKVQLAAWIIAMENEGRPARAVFGGPAGETLVQAVAELDANPTLRHWAITRFGDGTWTDELLGTLQLSTADLAPRYAGIMAARGLKSSPTRASFAGLKRIGAAPSNEQIVVARNAGVTTLRRVSDPDTQYAVAHAVTTFIESGNPLYPREFFGDPRIVGIVHHVTRRLAGKFDRTVVGDLPVTQDTRDHVRSGVLEELDELVADNLAYDPYVIVEPTNDPALAKAVPYDFGFRPYPTAEYVPGSGLIS